MHSMLGRCPGVWAPLYTPEGRTSGQYVTDYIVLKWVYAKSLRRIVSKFAQCIGACIFRLIYTSWQAKISQAPKQKLTSPLGDMWLKACLLLSYIILDNCSISSSL